MGGNRGILIHTSCSRINSKLGKGRNRIIWNKFVKESIKQINRINIDRTQLKKRNNVSTQLTRGRSQQRKPIMVNIVQKIRGICRKTERYKILRRG